MLTPEIIKSCQEVAAFTKEAAQYLQERIEKKLGKDTVSNDTRQYVSKFAKIVELELYDDGKYWNGLDPSTNPVENLQTNLAKEVAPSVASIPEIVMHCSINPKDSTLKRCYVVDGQVLKEEEAQQRQVGRDFDALVNTWLAKKGIIINDKGVAMRGNQLADPAELAQELQAFSQAFPQYMSALTDKNMANIRFTTHVHPYVVPQERVEVTRSIS